MEYIIVDKIEDASHWVAQIDDCCGDETACFVTAGRMYELILNLKDEVVIVTDVGEESPEYSCHAGYFIKARRGELDIILEKYGFSIGLPLSQWEIDKLLKKMDL